MTDIFFYDFDFNCLADLPKVISLNFTKKYCGYGTAEVHFSLKETKVIEMLENYDYVFFTAGDNAAIVTGWRVDEDIAVFGRTPEWLLTKRGVRAFSKSDSLAEDIVSYAVTSAAGDFLAVGEGAKLGKTMEYSTDKVRILYDVACEVLSKQGLGFKVMPDIEAKQFTFSVYSGAEALCIISSSNRTAYDISYTVEKQDMVTNSGWYERKFVNMGKWDAYNNSPSLSDKQNSNAYTFYEIISETHYQSGGVYYPVERFGLACTKGYYIYSDAETGEWKITSQKPDTIWVYLNNSKETGARKWDAVLMGTKTKAEAIAQIAQMERVDKTESETRNIVFGKDYLLGDIIRVQTEFGELKRTERKRVASVNIYYDIDSCGVLPILEKLEE